MRISIPFCLLTVEMMQAAAQVPPPSLPCCDGRIHSGGSQKKAALVMGLAEAMRENLRSWGCSFHFALSHICHVAWRDPSSWKLE